MSKQLQLNARPRSGSGRSAASKLRSTGFVPAVIYGSRIQPRSLQVSRGEISALLSHAAGENLLLDLQINEDGKTESHLALLQEVQHHPVNGSIVHVDLLAVSQDEKLQSSVPVEPVGTAIGVKSFGGLLEQLVRQIEVECLPKDLPEVIRADVSHLGLGESLHISDLQLPAGVTAVADPSLTIFHVTAPRVEEETTASAEAPSQPEVIKEKKEEGSEAKDSK